MVWNHQCSFRLNEYFALKTFCPLFTWAKYAKKKKKSKNHVRVMESPYEQQILRSRKGI